MDLCSTGLRTTKLAGMLLSTSLVTLQKFAEFGCEEDNIFSLPGSAFASRPELASIPFLDGRKGDEHAKEAAARLRR